MNKESLNKIPCSAVLLIPWHNVQNKAKPASQQSVTIDEVDHQEQAHMKKLNSVIVIIVGIRKRSFVTWQRTGEQSYWF